MISNIEKRDDMFNVGFIESKLFNKKIEVWIENTVDMNYANKCAENFESFAEINEKVPCDISGRDILKYVENPTIYIFPPEGDGIGYVIEGNCEWEPEHGIDIIMLDNKVMDVGPGEGLSPWSDDDEYERLF